MRQTILSVVGRRSTERPASVRPHEAFKRQQEEAGWRFTAGSRTVCLRCTRRAIFPGAHYDPIFVIEANFDGSPELLGQMEATLADLLRPSCAAARGPRTVAGSHDAVTKPDSRVSGRRVLAAERSAPASFIRATGTRADRMTARAGALWPSGRSSRKQPDSAKSYRAIQAEQIHVRLRNAMVRRFRGWRSGAAEEFPGSSGRRIFAGCSRSCLPLSSAFRFPEWRWAVTPAWRCRVLTAVLAGLVGSACGPCTAPGRRRRADPFRRPDPGQPVGEEQATSFAHPHPGAGLLIVLALYVVVAR